MSRYFTLVFILLSFVAQSQSMQGIVKDAITGIPLYPVIVVNRTTQQAVTTNDKGFYSISAAPGQIVAFSFIGYSTEEKMRILGVASAQLDVLMHPLDYELQEFKIRPDSLTRYQRDSIENQAIYKLPLQRTHPSPVMSPFSAIAEKFSKQAKMVYQFQRNFQAGEMERFVDTRYYPALVTKLTGLTGDSIGHFMYAYPMPYDFARAATDLEIKIWIRDSFKEWSKKMANDSLKKEE